MNRYRLITFDHWDINHELEEVQSHEIRVDPDITAKMVDRKENIIEVGGVKLQLPPYCENIVIDNTIYEKPEEGRERKPIILSAGH